MFDLKENLKKLPDAPGVYMHKDNLGQIIYVGKAISLRNRVRQYFQSSRNLDAKARAMVKHIDSFEYIRCGSEKEALILENNLIKKHKPKYNILLRDDKTYPYIKITSEKWPRIEKTRRIEKDGAKYFGPYTDVGAVNETVELLSKVYKLKKCRMKVFTSGFKPCLNHFIDQCNGMCIGKEDFFDYQNRLKEVENFLRGRSMNIIKFLEDNMLEASEKMEYEKAAIYRDQINSAKTLQDRQRVNLNRNIDMDILIAGANDDVVVFKVENGVLSNREIYYVDGDDFTKAERIEAFIKQHYSNLLEGISEIIVDEKIEDKSLIEAYLRDLWSTKVKITQEPKGDKKKLLDLAKQDVFELINVSESHKKNRQAKEEAIERSLLDLVNKAFKSGDRTEIVDDETGEIVELFQDDMRVEAYDISNTSGSDNVGVMVVFEGISKNKKAYRKFKVRSTNEKSDDYTAMREVVFRRLKRGLEGDKGFLPLPKILLIDGGKGHIHIVQELVSSLNLPIAVVGMVKDNSHRTDRLVYFNSFNESIENIGDVSGGTLDIGEIQLKNSKRGNERNLFYSYIGNIQEEVHRFAIDYHRGLRSKSMLDSELEKIQGIGAKKRASLLKHFGSISKIREASIDELTCVEGISERNARDIREFYQSM